ncbi:sulfate ABC transporter permease subunit CysW [soil metagenome]
MKWFLIAFTLVFLTLFLFLPLVVIFFEAFREGWHAYVDALSDPDTLHSIYLTFVTAGVAVPLNLVFGIAAAWAITKFEFRGKRFLLALIDLPFAVSPVVAGLVFVLIFGKRGWLGPWLENLHWTGVEWAGFSAQSWWPFVVTHNVGLKIIFATPGIILATIFVTFPFIARELIPLMQAQGTDEEIAARVLGAGGFKTFWKITLPNIKWGLLYGVILCNARAMGEFGAVYVVSGSIRGETCTMPLRVEILYADNYQAAFAVASVLAFLAVITLILKSIVEWKVARDLAAATAS